MKITGELRHELEQLDLNMGQYMALSRRTPAEVVAQKGAQIIMGNKSPSFPGLYEALRDLAPVESSITVGRLAALKATPRGIRRPVKVRRRARSRADAMLSGRPSGLFSIASRNGGRQYVRQVRFRKSGDRRISNRSNRGGVLRISRRSHAQDGERLLNRISLGIALELMMREQGRGYMAISFLPKAYRRMLGSVRSAVRRDKQAKGQRKVKMAQALNEGVMRITQNKAMRNSSGQVLGSLHFTSEGGGAALRIIGRTPPQKRAEAKSRVTDVLHYVNADMGVYLSRKLGHNKATVGRLDN